MDRGIEIDLLGPLVVRAAGRPISLSGYKPRALLAALALTPGQPVLGSFLSAVLWDDSPPPRGTLYTYIRRLRSVLGDAVATVADGYRLDVPPDRIDLHRFRALVDSARQRPIEERRELLATAVRLWRGQPFADLRSDYLDRDVAPGLVEELLAGVEERVDADMAAGEATGTATALRELIARYPLRESLWVRLLSALRQAGRPAEALDAYTTIRTRLADELGADPGEQLQEAYQSLLAGAAPVENAPPPAPVPRQLPYDIRHFLGREFELGLLDKQLDDRAGDTTMILTIAGPAGAGKTALAVHWAQRVRDRFPDGQLYVDLRGFGPGEALETDVVLEMFLRALGISGREIPSGVQARSALLRSTMAGREFLVVLDNANDADQVRWLLPGLGSVVLVTSRSRLSGLSTREGAIRITIGGMKSEQALDLIGRYVDQSRLAFEMPSAQALIALCGHLPLPLRIMADRLARDLELRLSDVVAEISAGDSLDAFRDEDSATDLRAVFSSSYQALDPESARMFRLLGVYPGQEIDSYAAAALVGVGERESARLLDRLRAMSLVQHRRRDRYALHDLLRAYAAELAQLDPAESAAAEDRMKQWFLYTARDAEGALSKSIVSTEIPPRPPRLPSFDFVDGKQRLDWFETERATLLAVLDRSLAAGDDAYVCDLGLPVVRLLMFREYGDDVVLFGNSMLGAARRVGKLVCQFAAFHALANVATDREADAEVAEYQRQMLNIARRIGNPAYEMLTYRSIGWSHGQAGRPAQSIEPTGKALSISRDLNIPRWTGICLNDLAYDHTQVGDCEKAWSLAREALAILLTAGNDRDIAACLDTLGLAAAGLGRYDDAMNYFRDAIGSMRESGLDDPRLRGEFLISLGRARRESGQIDAAREAWQQALADFTRIGHRQAETVAALIAELDPPIESRG